jgi:hypothetical protein
MVKRFPPTSVLSILMLIQMSSSQVGPSPQTPQSTFPANRLDTPVENVALLPSLPALPRGKTTVLGGTIYRLDSVRDQLTLKVFGGGRLKVLFDGRTRIYRNDLSAGHRRDLRDGERVHLDTVLDGTKVLARNIYILTQTPAGESYGQVVSYKPATGELIMTGSLSATTMKVQLVPGTAVLRHDQSISPGALRTGSLVSVTFFTLGDGRTVAHEISVLAEPGDVSEFAGRVTHLDLHAGLVVLEDPRDQKTYEIYFDLSVVPPGDRFREGANVIVLAGFNGTRYVANKLTVSPSSSK